MRVKIDLEFEADDYGQLMDRLRLFQDSVVQDFTESFDELRKDYEADDETFSGTWSMDRYDMEIEL